MSEKNLLGTRVITQIGIIVRDIDAVSQVYADFPGSRKPAGAGRMDMKKPILSFTAKPVMPGLSLLFQHGPGAAELIEPDENPSTWRSFWISTVKESIILPL